MCTYIYGTLKSRSRSSIYLIHYYFIHFELSIFIRGDVTERQGEEPWTLHHHTSHGLYPSSGYYRRVDLPPPSKKGMTLKISTFLLRHEPPDLSFLSREQASTRCAYTAVAEKHLSV